MRYISTFELFEAFETDHIINRYDLRAKDIVFESGVDGLSEEDLKDIGEKILELWAEYREDLKKYDIEWNRGYEERGYYFSFGDIVVKKGENYYYPVLNVKKGKASEESYSGSILCAICWGNKAVTILLFPRKCKYTLKSLDCKDPLDHQYAIDKFKRDKERYLASKGMRGTPYTIHQGSDFDEVGLKMWKAPKVNLILLKTEEEKEKDKIAKIDRELLNKIKGVATIKKLTAGKPIVYQTRVDGQESTFKRNIISQKNIGTQKDFLIEMILSQSQGGPNVRKTFKKGDKILVKISNITKNPDDQLALELGYTHYLAEIERYSINKEKEAFFSCRILRPAIYNQ